MYAIGRELITAMLVARAGKCGSCRGCLGADCCADSNDGKFFAVPGDTVQAVYRDSSPADYIKITRVVPSTGIHLNLRDLLNGVHCGLPS